MDLQLDIIPSTAEWRAWFVAGERKIRDIYCLSPERLISEYRHEQEITRGYHGREILELLQNAADAAKEAGLRGRVRICVMPEGVAVGNTGRPFDVGGVKSLQTANLSPKRQRQKSVIGDKGLGFRSILNWTDCPLISSGDLGLAFLPGYAESVVADLVSNSPELAGWVAKEQGHACGLIAPKLAFPEFVANWGQHQWVDPRIQLMAELCQTLRTEGFQSAIGMPFVDADAAYGEALKQIEELGPEILLFVDSLDCLEIETEGRDSRRTWKREESGAFVSVLEDDRTLGVWSVHSVAGEVPETLIDNDEATHNGYQIIIAVPVEGTLTTNTFLHCFFPTEVELPLPVTCHATLRLDETRKHLSDIPANRFILDQIASQLSDIAGKLTQLDKDDRWKACRLVVPAGAWGSELKKFGFPQKLKESASGKDIIPTLSGIWCSPGSARLAPGSRTDWLPARHFPEVAQVETADHRKIGKHFEVTMITGEEAARRLSSATDLSVEQRAVVIAGLLNEADPPANGWPASLLLDENGECVPEDCPVILQPSGQLPQLPEWAKIRMLHRGLRERLAALLDVTVGRDLQQELKSFGVVEYSLAALIGPVIAEANRAIRTDSSREESIQSEVVEFLYKVYRSMASQGELGTFPTTSTVKLPSQGGGFIPANELYLGDGFGDEGTISQDLFKGWAVEKLLSKDRLPELDGSTLEISRFLLWLGVARWPREKLLRSVPPEFLEEIIQKIPYPARFQNYDEEFGSPDELPSPLASDFRSLDGLDEILRLAHPAAVLGWVLKDERAAAWELTSPEHGKFSIDPKGVHYRRKWEKPLPSYIRWRISTTLWLPCTSGERMPPARCLLGDRLIENLFPRPADPGSELCSRYGIFAHLPTAFRKVGVVPSLAHFSRDEVYRILLELPDVSSDGKASKAICRWLLQHDADLYGAPGEFQKRFFREGRMWGSKENVQGYIPVTELRHVDADGFPAGLLQKLCIVELPKRVGADKVERIFGIKSVERAGIRQELVDHRVSPTSIVQEYSFEQSKPFLTRLRQSHTAQSTYLGALERLKLVLCDEVKVRLIYEGRVHDYEAGYWEWFIFDNSLYLRGEEEEAPDLLADAIGSAIAAVFRVGDGDAFAKVFRCEHTSRGRLLAKMCGDNVLSEIEEAQSVHAKGSGYLGPIEPLRKRPDQVSENEDKGRDEIDSVTPNETIQPTGANHGQDGPRAGITPVAHVQVPPKPRRKLVIRKVERRTGSARVRVVVDGELCERKAMEFEESDSPPRFPLLVGPITGIEAPGCDLLSFATNEEREEFRSSAARDWGSVARFIEVKGRSSSTAKIELSGNELEAAKRYKDRYYLYRLHEPEDGIYSISILREPLADHAAVSPAVYINFETAKTTHRFEFVPVDAGAVPAQARENGDE